MNIDSLSAFPSVWWISIGSKDILQDGCSLQSIHAGTIKLIESLERQFKSQKRQPTIIISGLDDSESLSANDEAAIRLFNERIECTVLRINDSASDEPRANVEFFKVQSVQDDDDDFFSDVSYSSSSKTTTMDQKEQILAMIADFL